MAVHRKTIRAPGDYQHIRQSRGDTVRRIEVLATGLIATTSSLTSAFTRLTGQLVIITESPNSA